MLSWFRSLFPAELRGLDATLRRVIVAIAVAGCLLRFFFWAYTGRIWEDALITVLHSENAGAGLGLTHHHPGQPPLHGFTSPFSVLIPLAADIFHPGWGVKLLQLVSALIAIPTVLLAAAIAVRLEVNRWLVLLLCSYLAFEHHQILWGMAGMETEVAVFVLFLTMYMAVRKNWPGLGIGAALCLYTRPDYAIFLLFVGLYVLITERAAILKVVGIAAALYAPWLIFTTAYYGSPLPNTIVAKGLGYPLWIRSVKPFSKAFFETAWVRTWDYIYLPLGPSFAGHGSGFLHFADDAAISHLALFFILAGLIALATRPHRFLVIPVGMFAAYSVYYVFLVQGIFGWYLVPFSAVNCLLLVLGLNALFASFVLPSRIPLLAGMVCAAYVLPFVAVLPTTFRAERDIQRYIETPVRMAIGKYLFEHKAPGDRIACEPLGYIAYYSRMPVYDYPGLASGEVTTFLKQNPDKRCFDRVLEQFQPEWIVLREHELNYLSQLAHMSFLKTRYSVEKTFRADPGQSGRIFRADQNIDLTFVLLKRIG